jgi:two-component system OmpR family response regulator
VNGHAREPRILIIDRDDDSSFLVATCLREDGYAVLRATDAEEGLRIAAESEPDLVLLDLSPKRVGLEVFRRLRMAGDVPIIIASFTGSETDRTLALELGADDYVLKPFGPRELVARVNAVLRRSRCVCGLRRGSTASVPRGELEIDRSAYRARRAGRVLPLTPTEFRILEALARHPGQILTRAQLLEYVASEGDVFDRTLDKHIANLRKKIEDDPARPRYVLTVFGVGYKYSA